MSSILTTRPSWVLRSSLRELTSPIPSLPFTLSRLYQYLELGSRFQCHLSSKNTSHHSVRYSRTSAISFPCVDQHEARSAIILESKQESKSNGSSGLADQNLGVNASRAHSRTEQASVGPEPHYSRLTSGYQIYHHPHRFQLNYGQSLSEFDIAYETWGNLSEKRDNVILLHTGLSASSHAKSHDQNLTPGWWEQFMGHGSKFPIDLDRYFVICTNVLGSCYGSTGPSSPNPATGEPYATHFPIITIFDMVAAQFLLLDHLGIDRLYASIGSSMGGMQSIAAAWMRPDRVEKVVSISGCGRSAPSSIALRYAQRSVLMADPNWNRGFYYHHLPPHVGMKLARQIATITYRSGPEWEQRFGRRRQMMRSNEDQNDAKSISAPVLCPDFLIETYLDHQGEQFCLKYDANSLIYVSKAMDLFDLTFEGLAHITAFRSQENLPTGNQNHPDPSCSPSSNLVPFETIVSQTIQETERSKTHVSSLPNPNLGLVESLSKTFQSLKHHPILILGAQSDILFPIHQQRELAEAMRLAGNKNVIYYELDSPYGHDTFLIDLAGVGSAIRGFLS
ncbi:hypothetical protein CROQUDRAFT_656291 [Cronartium quercuum f. sp. fusiforme G11]|uniref:AB hydrolase-1 domain-containing protein n=1 Tax=Cronartium quercuum f. sp. fusiforme G11 TaxID=708437 RepID=A0A9P6NNG9_9BASI|nr:hypothetical protein CROQUDRAFT_656291 [Cronartium quercuum f. sp. fusiforme G11]